MKRTRRTALITAASAVVVALAGCTSAGGTTGGSGGDGSEITELRVGTFLPFFSWDPALADIGFDGPYLSAVYDPLVALDENSQPIPALATDWKWSDDRKTLTMNLRKDVTFTDGEAFDADAAVANLEHLRTGVRSGSTYQDVTGVIAVDEDTVQIQLSEPDDALLYYMGLGRSWMASPKAIEADSLVDSPVGSGPYTFESDQSTPGSEYVFAKKDDHWDADTYPFETVRLLPITDQTASLNAMLAGQLDVNYANAADIPKAKENGWNVAQVPATWVGLQFADRTGAQLKPLGDVRVRQAISHAFDAAGILASTGAEGAGTVTDQLWPVTSPVYDKSLNGMYDYDVAKAKALLAEAGYPNGFDVTMPMSPIFATWQPAAQQSLEAIGIKVTWEDMAPPDYQKNAPTYPMFLAVIAMDSNDMATLKSQVTTEQWYNANPGVESVPELQQLITQAQQAGPDQQTEALQKVNEKLLELAWWDVWYQANNSYFSVPGVTVTPITGMMFPTLRFIQRG